MAQPDEAGVRAGWPIDPSSVRAAIEMLAKDLESGAGASREDGIDHSDRGEDPRVALRIELETDAGPWGVEIGQEQLGGRRWARVTRPERSAREGSVDWQIAEFFEPRGVRAWRVPSPVPIQLGRAVGLALEARGSESLRMARESGAWWVEAPLRARGRAQTVQRVVSAVRAGSLVELLEDSSGEQGSGAYGLSEDERVIELTLEAAAPHGIGGSDSWIRASVVVGNEVSLASDERYVLSEGWIETPGSEPERLWGPLVGIAKIDDIADAFPTVDACLSRRSIGFSPADVESVRVIETEGGEGVRYRRSAGRWLELPGDVPAPDHVQHGLAAAVALLSETEAGVARRQPLDIRRLVTYELDPVGAEPVRVTLGVYRDPGDAGNGSRTIATESEGVWRVYEPSPGVEALIRRLDPGANASGG